MHRRAEDYPQYSFLSLSTGLSPQVQQIIKKSTQMLETVNYYYKELQLRCCSSPRSTTDYVHATSQGSSYEKCI